MAVESQKQWDFLQKSAELGKIAHAYLFYGEESSGKKELALEFVRLINCETRGSKPCRACRTCREIERGTSPDLFLIEPEGGEIKINRIRELHSRLALRSYSSPYKTAVISRAHTLNGEAQSAFLKLLEEPKGKTVFLLLTEYPEMLLPTILSRVERIRISPSSSKKLNMASCEKIASELEALGKNDLFWRFAYAKKMTEDQEELERKLSVWLAYFRDQLFASLEGKKTAYSTARLIKILNSIQTASLLVSTTNTSPRLTLEVLMLEL